jgi:uncharacterized protein (DUF58 family)
MDTKEIFKKVRQLEISTKGLVNNIFGGEYHSAFKGRGMVFSEVRAYQYGDDIRAIDWNVTARTGDPFIKVFEEEREQTLMLCVDISSSESFGSKDQSKKDLAIEMCAVMAFSAIQNSDKVGLILFTDKIEKVVLPKKGKKHVLRLIRELFTTKPEGSGTDISMALDYVNKMLTRRSIIIMASDFISADFEKSMKITNKKHDLVNILIHDPLEFELPDLGVIPMQDAESGDIVWVDTSNKSVRQKFRKKRFKQIGEQKERFKQLMVDTVDVSTNSSYVKPLMSFFKRRASRY